MLYGREFARLMGGVVMDRRRATARRRGGEPLNTVMTQPETDELYQLSPGFFLLSNCGVNSTPPPVAFHRGNYLNDWMTATRLEPGVVCSAKLLILQTNTTQIMSN